MQQKSTGVSRNAARNVVPRAVARNTPLYPLGEVRGEGERQAPRPGPGTCP